MLVWDRNGNGLIDSGQELFGDETILVNGKKAAHGFAALSELDAGSTVNGVKVGAGDGVFDAKDAEYANLRIWRDLNQDGISQASELKTLAETGVASIKIGSATTNFNYGDAILAQSGTFTRADGNSAQAGSFILAQNNFVREFSPITISDAAKALPDIKGGGWVRDLREAATLSPELVDLLNAAKNSPTRAGYKNAIAGLLREWGNDSGYSSASKQALNAGYGLILSDPADAQEAGWMDVAIKASEEDRNAFRAALSAEDLTKFDAMRERMVGGLEKIHAYEAFTGYAFLTWPQIQGDAVNYTPRFVQNGRVPVEMWVPFSQIIYENRNAFMSSQDGYIRVNIPVPLNGVSHIETLWNRVVDDASDNLMPSLRLSKYIEMIDLNIGLSGVEFDFSRLNEGLNAAGAKNILEGSAVVLDLYRIHGSMLEGLGWNGTQQVRELIQRSASEAAVHDAFVATGFTFFASGSAVGTQGRDIFIGDASANTFSAGAGDDLLEGHAGNDNLLGDAGNDLIFGGDGDDAINAGSGNDQVEGGQGADMIDGGAGDDVIAGGDGDDTITDTSGNNVLQGGAGNDTITGRGTMEGGQGNDLLKSSDIYAGDIYLFNLGDGQDTISEYGYNRAAWWGTGGDDTLSFGAGIEASAVTLVRSGNDLTFRISATDQVTVKDWFVDSFRYIEKVQFADGTSWDMAKLQAMVPEAYSGSDAADTLNGWDGIDRLSGLAGNDTLNGYGGNDILDGGDGDDTINAGSGNDQVMGGQGADTIDGGAGDDVIAGGDGNDTYLFGRGDGQDTITFDYAVLEGKLNVLRFKPGVSAQDVTVRRSGDSLVVGISGTSDQVTVENFFFINDPQNFSNPVQQVRFNDGTTWDISALAAMAMVGGAGNDTLVGTSADDVINGNAGNDRLSGGAGNDTYLFGRGDGQDTIAFDYAALEGKLNVLRFKPGVSAQDVTVWRSGDSLVVGIAGTSDQVTVENFFFINDPQNLSNPVQQLRFSDGTTWNIDTLTSMAMVGGSGDDVLVGSVAGDVINGNAGNDRLSGGAGNDTYLFGRGDGQDTIAFDYAALDGKLNAVRFKPGVSAQDVTVQRSGDSLVLGITGTSDQVTVENFFFVNDPQNLSNPVQQVRFDDGTTWDIDALVARAMTGGTGDDSLTGTVAADVIVGNAGNDSLYGRGGDDVLEGGAGHDLLLGEAGNDTLKGGAGADWIEGGSGNDTYLFGRGDGADGVADVDATEGNVDTLQFLSGIASDQLWFEQVSGTSALRVSVIGTDDSVTIHGWYDGAANHVEQFRTFDGKTLTDAGVANLVQAMASFSPPAAGQTTLPQDYADSLQPRIAANWQ